MSSDPVAEPAPLLKPDNLGLLRLGGEGAGVIVWGKAWTEVPIRQRRELLTYWIRALDQQLDIEWTKPE